MTNEFRELARHAAHRTAPENFALENVDTAFREELKIIVVLMLCS